MEKVLSQYEENGVVYYCAGYQGKFGTVLVIESDVDLFDAKCEQIEQMDEASFQTRLRQDYEENNQLMDDYPSLRRHIGSE